MAPNIAGSLHHREPEHLSTRRRGSTGWIFDTRISAGALCKNLSTCLCLFFSDAFQIVFPDVFSLYNQGVEYGSTTSNPSRQMRITARD